MSKYAISKKSLSVEQIGKRRFWIGTTAGVLMAIALAFLFNYFREALRLVMGLQFDLFILTDHEYSFYNHFYASLSVVLGLSISIWIWMGTRGSRKRHDHLFKRSAQSHAQLVFWIILFLVARVATMVFILISGTTDLLRDNGIYYWLIFALLPIYVFLQNWFIVQRVYRSGKWIRYSFALCLLTAVILAQVSAPGMEHVNQVYNKQYDSEYHYIDRELENADLLYGITFNDNTRQVLKEWYSPRTLQQSDAVVNAFKRSDRISMDTIILGKIVQHNLKFRARHWQMTQLGEYWRYIAPKYLYRQIKKQEPDAAEVKELFLILKEQIELYDTPSLDYNNGVSYSRFEGERSAFARKKFQYFVALQLEHVRNSLISDPNYMEYWALLPEINPGTKGMFVPQAPQDMNE